MSRKVNVEELPQRINEVISALEAGESVTYLRNGKEIGRSGSVGPVPDVPYPFRDLHISPLSRPVPIDAVELLRQDRDDEYPR
jgi:hypothetical protein